MLKPETALEMNNGYCPVACPIQDGVFYDPKDHLYKIWYHAGWFDGTAYACSEDGLRWVRPNLDIEAGTTRVLPRRDPSLRDGAGVWLDLATSDPRQRFKMFVYFRKCKPDQFRYGELYNGMTESEGGNVYASPDGIHWSGPTPTGPAPTTPISSITLSARPGFIASVRSTNAAVSAATASALTSCMAHSGPT